MLGKILPSDRKASSEISNPQEVTLTVTDVFWMTDKQAGVAGVLEDGTPVRLQVGDSGPDEAWLKAAGRDYVTPFSTLRLQLGDAPQNISPLFPEERQAAPGGHRTLRVLDRPEIEAFLEETCSASVREIFGAQIHVDPGGGKDWYVARGEGERSLGTVKVAEVHSVTARRNRDEGFMDFRLSFTDASGESYKLSIADLVSQTYFAALGDDGHSPQDVGRRVRDSLRKAQPLYLRVALSRPNEAHPDRCYLQVSGMVTLANPETPPAPGDWSEGHASRSARRLRRP